MCACHHDVDQLSTEACTRVHTELLHMLQLVTMSGAPIDGCSIRSPHRAHRVLVHYISCSHAQQGCGYSCIQLLTSEASLPSGTLPPPLAAACKHKQNSRNCISMPAFGGHTVQQAPSGSAVPTSTASALDHSLQGSQLLLPTLLAWPPDTPADGCDSTSGDGRGRSLASAANTYCPRASRVNALSAPSTCSGT